MDSQPYISPLVQVIIGVVIVTILYIMTLVFLDIEKIVDLPTNVVVSKETTVILSGKGPLAQIANKRYNTQNQYATNFKKCARSLNTRGGRQFSYQFWVKIDETSDNIYKDMIILMQGDIRKYKKGYYNMTGNNSQIATKPADHAIFCPMIKFGKSFREIIVKINTLRTMETSFTITSSNVATTASRSNIFSLLPLNWYMMTFTFEDNIDPNSGFENGIRFRFWLNDIQVADENATTNPVLLNNSIQDNYGDLHLFPNVVTTMNSAQFGNFIYYNYAVQPEDIAKMYINGPPTNDMEDIRQVENKPAIISAYNKIDMYNY